MLTEEQALYFWQDFELIDATLERLRPMGVGDPVVFRVLVPAKTLSGRQINDVIKSAGTHDAEVGIVVREGDPYLVLS